MTPFDDLGVPRNCSIDIAKKAFQKLASRHHPDKGGTKERFQEIQVAWSKIERGYRCEEVFPKKPFAGDPAPGYEAKRTPPVFPRSTTRNRENFVVLEITEDQAFEGCTVPFIHNDRVYTLSVSPGTASYERTQTFLENEMIGQRTSHFQIHVHLKVLGKQLSPEEQTRDATIEVLICALGLFTGGKVSVHDHLGEKITITIPPGHNPAEVFKFAGHGYGRPENRGTMIVKFLPVFKVPADFNSNERSQLERLNEMIL